MAVKLVTGDGDMNLTTDGTMMCFTDDATAELTIKLAALDTADIRLCSGLQHRRSTERVINGDTLEVRNALLIERLKLSGKAAEIIEPLAQGMAICHRRRPRPAARWR